MREKLNKIARLLYSRGKVLEAFEVYRVANFELSARLVQKKNKNTDRKEWALVSKKDPSKVLKWFGTSKPSEEAVQKEEKRVQYFKNKG